MLNYFFGKNISDFYHKRIKKHPEEERKLIKEMDKYLIWYKFVPNIITLTGIATMTAGCFYGDAPCAASGATGFIIGEGIRFYGKEHYRFDFLEMDYAAKDCCDTFDKVTNDKKFMNNLAKEIKKSIKKNN